MSETAILEWTACVGEDYSVKAPAGMIRVVRGNRRGHVVMRDFATLQEAERNVALGMDDINIMAHFHDESGHVFHEYNPLAQTIATDWRDLTSMWPKAPKGMVRVVASDTEHPYSIERDFATLAEAIRSEETQPNKVWADDVSVHDDTGKIIHKM